MKMATADRKYTIEDYSAFVGKQGQSNRDPLSPLPNPEDVDPGYFLNDLAARGHMMTPVWGYAVPPSGTGRQWTQFFFLHDANMGFGLGGGGYAVTYGSSRWDAEAKKSIAQPIVRRFQICRHEKELAAGADPLRGWRPGKCKHCGMDMTIDSGD